MIGLEVEANANMLTKDWEHPHTCTRNSPKIDNPQPQLTHKVDASVLANMKLVWKKNPKT